ncbi:hypothetical protein [Deferribacter abyssi]|uniref:hypothetical protein n=1 Tax=Deferribacter abyssi TaxID=213806 RepID=UPI003C192379
MRNEIILILLSIFLFSCSYSNVVRVKNFYRTPKTRFEYTDNYLILKNLSQDGRMYIELQIINNDKVVANYIKYLDYQEISKIKVSLDEYCVNYREKLLNTFDDDYFNFGTICFNSN